MTQIDLGLTAEFSDKLRQLLDACAVRGVIMRPYFGIRPPQEQAKLWRQSRSAAAINQEIVVLKNANAPFLANCIAGAGICRGPWATNATPGLSWHQYGVACDCAWIVNGDPEWSASPGGPNNGYRVYAQEAQKLGLTTLGSIGDWGHVQEPSRAAPDSMPGGYTLADIDKIMQEKWG